MSKIIIDKKTKTVKFSYSDNEQVIMGEVIHIPNNPPPRVVHHTNGRTITYLGGTYICDKEFIVNSELIENINNLPEDYKGGKYLYHKEVKQFTLNPFFKEELIGPE